MNNLNSVFVVDDDLSARRGIARLLHTAGYDVRDFSSANEFRETLGHETPGCVVLDAGILDEIVDELQKEIGTGGSELPIIVMTAHDDPQSRRQALRLNAIGYFRKPIDGPALLDAIDWAMQKGVGENNHEKS
jgi:FixJ family two-component response regulator